MSYASRDVKDRIVQHPGRYQLNPVSGDIYDLVPVPGTVYEEGTDINKAYLQGIEDGIAEYGMPSGGIIMWSGLIINIPTGWALCDGLNGTPNLRDRFIVGAGSSYSVNEFGGLASVTLTGSQLPAHSHTGTTNSTGAHTHPVPIHTYTGTVSAHNSGGISSKPSNGSEDGTSPTSSSGAHSHTVTTTNTGGGTSHENRPPYLALAFIMKL